MPDTVTPLGRQPASRFGPLHAGIILALVKAKNLLDVGFRIWPSVVEVSVPTFNDIVEGRAPLTFTTATAIHRIAIILDVPPNAITTHPLPPIPRSIAEGDIARLRKLKPTPYVAAHGCRGCGSVLSAGYVAARAEPSA